MDFDEIKIVVMDDKNAEPELEVRLYDDCVVLTQTQEYGEGLEADQEIRITPRQFHELLLSMSQTEGVYQTK